MITDLSSITLSNITNDALFFEYIISYEHQLVRGKKHSPEDTRSCVNFKNIDHICGHTDIRLTFCVQILDSKKYLYVIIASAFFLFYFLASWKI
ncbi:MAG: hypothetical protein A2504_01740 [Bdellovibrionales bacterium RIFOXYD12_FULL_39_22]|nr:MAG: hypothetical protein A2385_04265 [Bdellovibrionales bacterium RIFOXYB1_FULL_39_21]OFZ42372.1 MAG: hypothetical protein A2485_15230 [Bdellovibrionales bacterium RIFOXYC12_FULL_39_17]OFZ46327.1 MAG: hypothetical protein A2404_13785 [Bdellovibrionales bacterium RIFOXYC1_FULL_39_130]OFZ72496.1 MAG: hypothetical protein A2451_11345 [Bdellovibrionales bacterium RIFOXYC2_FULL_39_8]OFZ75220.1 MAG: hypothetical protein A2560_15840 [Bdellovibrionales bacterium RIFOXYD1_FULL_39_84]OFZ93214.1 MAG: